LIGDVEVVAPVLLSFLPYLFSGHWQLWITVYEAAVAYSKQQRSFAKKVLLTFHESSSVDGAIMLGAAILGAFIISRRWRDL